MVIIGTLVMTNRTNYMNKTNWVYESLREHSAMDTAFLNID